MTVPLLFAASKPACLLCRATGQEAKKTLKIYGDRVYENCEKALVRMVWLGFPGLHSSLARSDPLAI